MAGGNNQRAEDRRYARLIRQSAAAAAVCSRLALRYARMEIRIETRWI
jgi:hypothetical protein